MVAISLRKESLAQNKLMETVLLVGVRAKVDKEARRARMKEVEENICDIDEEISFKEKRRSQAETS